MISVAAVYFVSTFTMLVCYSVSFVVDGCIFTRYVVLNFIFFGFIRNTHLSYLFLYNMLKGE